VNPANFSRLKPKRLGVRLPNWIGDVIQVTPALRALRRAFPEAEMTMIGQGKVRDLIEAADWCQAFETDIPKKGLDAIVILPHSFRTAWNAWRAGVPARAGFKGELRSWLLTHPVPAIIGNRRTRPFSRITYIRRLLEGLGVPFEDFSLELPLDAAAESGVEGLLRDAGLDPSRPLVALNPGSAWGPTKRWPEEYFARAGDTLAEKLGGQVYILAGPGEMEEARRIAEKMSGTAAILDHEKATFPMTKSLIKRSAVVISNDSGPRHIAACYDVPAIVMVGPFHPVISHNGHPRTIMMYEGVDCSPCHLRECPTDLRCMTRITPEKVVAAAEGLLEAKKA
jgi:heptosyltransferase-2